MTGDRISDSGDAVLQILVAEAPLDETVERVAQLARDAAQSHVVQLVVYDDKGDPVARYDSDDLQTDAPDVVTVPLSAGGTDVGVLQLHGPDVDVAAADRFAARAAVVLANAQAYWSTRDLAVGLQAALDSRAVIDMAKGKLMAQGDITPDDAFALLVRASQRENVKLRDIAQRIVYGDAGADSGASGA